MNKPATTRNKATEADKMPPKRKPRAPSKTRKIAQVPAKSPALAPVNFKLKLALVFAELLGLGIAAVAAIIALLGYSAERFSGTGFFSSLLPFAIGVLGLVLLSALSLIGWWKLRAWLNTRAAIMVPVISLSLALLAGWLIIQDDYSLAYRSFRTLVGGKQEASRVTLAHQVYAAYRRYNMTQLLKLINRAEAYRKSIKEAAKVFGIDENLLKGVAATESSFLPRKSEDGGRGLFQITSVPKAVIAEAKKQLREDLIALDNPRHNAFVAAATLKYYLKQMNHDLFLGLLAYNIGSANGGLRFVMQQYGAKDFVTIQPYLQLLPRDYPIRVLSYSLAFRLWQKEGRLLAYEEGNNAVHIQMIGIPGLDQRF